MSVFSFLTGILFALQLSYLPPLGWLVVLPFAIILCFIHKKFRPFYLIIIGFFWVVMQGHYILWSSLDDDLQGKDLLVSGIIHSIPDKNSRRTRFTMAVGKMMDNGEPLLQFPKKIRLSWYDKYRGKIKAGEKWQFLVRLKLPHGMANPGGFDYEKWLFERRIRATGYVRKSIDNRRLNEAAGFFINAYRQNLKKKITKLVPDSRYLGIILALTIGDKSEINNKQWEVFTATGTNHLVAISGLHIGLVAGALFFLTGFIVKLWPRLFNYIASHKISAVVSILSAFIYAMLAGFAIPTQRALIMILVVMLFILFNRKLHARYILVTALVAVVIIDPFSLLSAGFWLSFIAVGSILFAMQNRLSTNSLWWKWGRLQWIVSVALIPALLYFFQVFSIISPLANLIAVPWVSILVVPFVLIGALFSNFTLIPEVCFWLADQTLNGIWIILEIMANLSFAKWEQFSPAPWTIVTSFIAVILLLAPRGLPARYLALFLFLPLFVVKVESPNAKQFSFTLLDVGQGLAAAVQTKNHFLLFDTGPSFSSSFNTGKTVVLPFMRSIGINKIDKLIVSHGDNDHIGGLTSILDKVTVNEIITSVPNKIDHQNVMVCHAGDHWEWDGVLFEMLNPKSINSKLKSGNNQSCVLRISIGNNAVLLSADIEKKTERLLVKEYQRQLASTILVVPHHGSNTSSTSVFIEKVNPEYALYPAGFRNRFGHPKKKVNDRYKKQKIKTLNTANTGAILFTISSDEIVGPEMYRILHKRIWHRY